MVKKYESDLAEAEAVLAKLLLDADALQTKIAKQKRKVAALRELTDITDDGEPKPDLVEGITDACRTVLRSAGRPLVPMDVRDQVQSLGIDQENLLASVHTILKRLKKSGEVEEVPLQPGLIGYRWLSLDERSLGRAFAADFETPGLLEGVLPKKHSQEELAAAFESLGSRFVRIAREKRDKQKK